MQYLYDGVIYETDKAYRIAELYNTGEDLYLTHRGNWFIVNMNNTARPIDVDDVLDLFLKYDYLELIKEYFPDYEFDYA